MSLLKHNSPNEYIHNHKEGEWESIVSLIRDSKNYSFKSQNSPFSSDNKLTPFRFLPSNSLLIAYI